MKLLEVEGEHVLQCPIAGDATAFDRCSRLVGSLLGWSMMTTTMTMMMR